MPAIGSMSVERSTKDSLTDRFGRKITYLRLAVTDRCNLRCTYCMPAGGVTSLDHSEILSYEEMERLARLLAGMGVNKIRLTGGEPFVRKGLLPFMQRLSAIPGINELHITTNGIETAAYVHQLESMRLAGVNLSLDTLRPERFARITRRDRFPAVRRSLDALLRSDIPLKINVVVQFGFNDDEIGDLAHLARTHPIHVRFIEEMPFNGQESGTPGRSSYWIEGRLKSLFPGMVSCGPQKGTARLYTVPDFRGKIGIISGANRTFCNLCNRIRLTADGKLKTCLYDNGVLDVKHLLRSGASDEAIRAALVHAVLNRYADGHITERLHKRQKHSMSQIGG